MTFRFEPGQSCGSFQRLGFPRPARGNTICKSLVALRKSEKVGKIIAAPRSGRTENTGSFHRAR
jgi:hypothetical protein